MRKYPRIKFSTHFEKQRKDSKVEIRKAFLYTLSMFLEDTEHQFLCNHTLRGKYAGYRSIDVTDDSRAVFKEARLGEKKLIIFHMLGTHKELYS